MTNVLFRCNNCNETNAVGLRGGVCNRCETPVAPPSNVQRLATFVQAYADYTSEGKTERAAVYANLIVTMHKEELAAMIKAGES